MKPSINQSTTQSTDANQSITWRLSGLSLLIVLSLTLTGCQRWPFTKNQESNSYTSPSEPLTQLTANQSTAEIWLDPQTLAVVINPTNLSESLSGISVRVQVKSNTTDMAFELLDTPYLLSPDIINQGWNAVINTTASTATGEVWADLALINTQPEGIHLTDTTTIATLAPLIKGNWTNPNFSLTIDPKMTKILTKSAQEVVVTIPSDSP